MNYLQNLNSINNYNTDKLGRNSVKNDYSKHYTFHFDPIKHNVSLFLEIGIYNGGSLEMWADYFPNATILGLDINSNYRPSRENIKVEIGDATDPRFIASILKKYGSPDIVLDDGSHLASQMRKSFDLLFSSTKMIYCIEDLGTQYTSSLGNYLDDTSMMSKLYALVDENNRYPPNDSSYTQICFNRYQCYIYKI